MCHMLKPGGPLTAPVYAPRGHDRPRQLVWFWRSVGLRQGGYGGACWGMGLQMGRSRRRGQEGRRESRTGWTVRRITEHKRHVSKTEWPVTTYDPMDDNGLNLRGLGSRVCVGGGHSCQLVPQRPCRLRKNRSCGSLHDVIRTQMTDVWPT